MLGWLLVTLLAWCVASVAVAFGLGWLIRRYPPQRSSIGKNSKDKTRQQ